MEKLKLSRIMARAEACELAPMARRVEERHPVSILKEPARTLVMLPMKEPERGTPFFLGELIATEAMVELEGTRGMGVCMGGDDDKALAMAVIDAAYNAGVRECGWLTEELEAMEKKQNAELTGQAAVHARTRVAFNTLEGQ